MKFSIGYQLPDELDSISEIIEDYYEHIGEIYFSWVNEPSGRSPLCDDDENEKKEVEEVQLRELKIVADKGVRPVLLLNANCYGAEAISCNLKDRVISLIDKLKNNIGLDCVTTTSPFLARCVKEKFSDIEIRASVNMRVGTTKAIEYLSDYFDGFYMQREYNRDFRVIKELKDFCDLKSKKLYMLANSGCMSFCSFQMFHDNMVAHDREVIKQNNAVIKHPSPCWDYLERHKDILAETFLQSSWIRPEDIHNYEQYFDNVKLATRLHSNPRKVISAYIRGKYKGNLMDLTEPGFSKLLKGEIIDNTKFPSDWFDFTTNCGRNCKSCGYCEGVAEKVTVSVSDLEKKYMF